MRGWLGTRCCQVLRDKYDINIWWGWPIIKKKKVFLIYLVLIRAPEVVENTTFIHWQWSLNQPSRLKKKKKIEDEEEDEDV
jgi:hypothetical protein